MYFAKKNNLYYFYSTVFNMLKYYFLTDFKYSHCRDGKVAIVNNRLALTYQVQKFSHSHICYTKRKRLPWNLSYPFTIIHTRSVFLKLFRSLKNLFLILSQCLFLFHSKIRGSLLFQLSAEQRRIATWLWLGLIQHTERIWKTRRTKQGLDTDKFEFLL